MILSMWSWRKYQDKYLQKWSSGVTEKDHYTVLEVQAQQTKDDMCSFGEEL